MTSADTRPLVREHLEGISRDAFDKHPVPLKALLKGKHGIYALYRRDRLYYVGLAKNLYSRISQHRRDGHARKWDRFSAYVTRQERLVRELEALALRVIMPDGNRQKGGFARSKNLKRDLAAKIQESARHEHASILGGGYAKRAARRAAKNLQGAELLARVTTKRRKLWAEYEGEDYHAVLLKNGSIRYEGVNYTSPRAAMRAITGRGGSGWRFWYYSLGRGEWAPLSDLKR